MKNNSIKIRKSITPLNKIEKFILGSANFDQRYGINMLIIIILIVFSLAWAGWTHS